MPSCGAVLQLNRRRMVVASGLLWQRAGWPVKVLVLIQLSTSNAANRSEPQICHTEAVKQQYCSLQTLWHYIEILANISYLASRLSTLLARLSEHTRKTLAASEPEQMISVAGVEAAMQESSSVPFEGNTRRRRRHARCRGPMGVLTRCSRRPFAT